MLYSMWAHRHVAGYDEAIFSVANRLRVSQPSSSYCCSTSKWRRISRSGKGFERL